MARMKYQTFLSRITCNVTNHESNSTRIAKRPSGNRAATVQARRHTAQPTRNSIAQKAASRAPPTPRPSASFGAIPAAPAIGAAEFPLGAAGVAGVCEEAPETVMATFCPPAQCDPVRGAREVPRAGLVEREGRAAAAVRRHRATEAARRVVRLRRQLVHGVRRPVREHCAVRSSEQRRHRTQARRQGSVIQS